MEYENTEIQKPRNSIIANSSKTDVFLAEKNGEYKHAQINQDMRIEK